MEAYAQNKKAYFEYEIERKMEAGIKLFGFEVKAVRAGLVQLSGAFVTIKGGEIFLTNAHISPYQPLNTPSSYNPERPRKLLLHKKELSSLIGIFQQKNLTILPISMYNKGDKIKIEIAVARKKKKYEKRETIKRKTTEREIEREMKK
ncbi:MAG: SsrA-binding protein SmpB [Candidatus Spechtbacteria bacterium]|nr:SsrA-binding protein SmpB [Candidatus Spechtbacteria bacterium]